jgi:hypothetical protein
VDGQRLFAHQEILGIIIDALGHSLQDSHLRVTERSELAPCIVLTS